ncbi:RagB/SusD family nutrient uptake outer membrane protein [Maribacter sp. 2-571]|uniref:RagB/SusD family nutrient uptake outer membrane protein n=1 Tax=Maribacter sp. 2-571 TaxID=3417569 RepID=UPI003D353097
MNTYITTKIGFVLLVLLTLGACETDFDNPNAATDEQVFSSREGILAAAAGMQQQYSTTGLRFIVETPAVTTREAGITTTFQNMIELEDGGTPLPNFNSNVQGLWSNLLRIISVSENIENNVASIPLEAGTQSGLLAHAKLFKALAIGGMAMNYEQVVLETNNDNNAAFVTRDAAFDAALGFLSEAKAAIMATPPSEEFTNVVTLGNIDLLNTINAMLARYNLIRGNYDAAIANASEVDQASTSTFVYDTQNLNPVWNRVFLNDAPNFKPRDNFGLPTELALDAADGRIAFYLVPLEETNQNGLPIEDLAGFFNVNTGPIPAYIPDEMNLIIAEAHLRKGTPDITAAIEAINLVRTDTDDPLGVNAALADYSGDTSVAALLDEVYINRRAELFLSGLSLEDSRRFGRPEPSGEIKNFEEERNRNFYPYPDLERNSNPNTPEDPAI